MYENEGISYGSEMQLGDMVYEKTIQTKDLPKRGNARLLKFDFPDALREYKGMYCLSIRSESQYYLRESRFISLSDIGLIAKQSRDKIWVFANSIKTTEKMSGPQISVMGKKQSSSG